MCVLGTVGGVLREVLREQVGEDGWSRVTAFWLRDIGGVKDIDPAEVPARSGCNAPLSMWECWPPSPRKHLRRGGGGGGGSGGGNGARDRPFVQDPLFGDNGACWTVVVHGTGHPRVGWCWMPGVVLVTADIPACFD